MYHIYLYTSNMVQIIYNEMISLQCTEYDEHWGLRWK